MLDRVVPLGRLLDVVEATQINVGPGGGAGVPRAAEDIFKALLRVFGIAFHQFDLGFDIHGLGVVLFGVGEAFFGDGHGTVEVTFEHFLLGQHHAGGLAGRAADELAGTLGEELDLFGTMAFAADVHAVDHLAHSLGEAVGVAFIGEKLVVEILHHDPALAHVEIDLFAAEDFSLAFVGGEFFVVAGKIGARAGAGRLDGDDEADVHGAGFNGFDQAFGEERHDIRLVNIVEGGILHWLEQRCKALHGGGASVDQGFNCVVQVEVADLVHADGARGGGGGYDDVIGGVDASVGAVGSEHGLDEDEEAAAIVAADGDLEVDVGAENGPGDGVVDLVCDGFILGAMLEPDCVERNVFRKGTDERQDVDDGECVGRHLGFICGGRELGCRADVQGEGDVLGEFAAFVAKFVVLHVTAQGVAAGLGWSGLRYDRSDFGADLGTNGMRVCEIGVVSARVEPGGEVKQGLAGFKSNGGTAGLGLACAGLSAGGRLGWSRGRRSRGR